MPLRDFRCPKCGHTEERLVKHGEAPHILCPNSCLEFDNNLGETGYAVLEPIAYGDTAHFRLAGRVWAKDGYSK